MKAKAQIVVEGTQGYSLENLRVSGNHALCKPVSGILGILGEERPGAARSNRPDFRLGLCQSDPQ